MPSALGFRKRTMSGVATTCEQASRDAPRKPRALRITGAAAAVLVATLLCLGFFQYRQVQLDQALVDANFAQDPSLPLVRKLLEQPAPLRAA